jgi:GNAT superfamily N-acetyltransferase
MVFVLLTPSSIGFSMKKAEYDEKELIVGILTRSFEGNQSVNYIIKQDNNRLKRINALMSYSFEICYLFGDVFLSEDKTACALILYPDRKRTTVKSILLDLELITKCIGITNLGKAMKRENQIKKIQPKELMCYLWFIGVDAKCQGLGNGTQMMLDIIAESKRLQRPIYLETSTLRNLPWYKKFGFEIYNELDLSYKLYFLKRELTK